MPPRSLLGWPEESSGAAPKNKNSLPMSQQLQESREERIMFPQHLQSLIQSTRKVTIITDNPKTPPLSDQSPVLRTERGLPPLFSPTSAATTMQYNKKPESRWDSMPQTTKRIIIDDNPINSSLARIRLNGQLRGGGAPAAAATTNGVTSTVTATTTAAGDQGGGACLSPVRWLDSPSGGSSSSSTSAGSPLNNTKYTQSPDKSPGLNFPRRRESLEQQQFVAGNDREGMSLLSQVLSAFDLSDDDEEEAAGGGGDDDERAGVAAAAKMTKQNVSEEENRSLKQLLGVGYTQSNSSFAKQQHRTQDRSPQPVTTQKSIDTLSKPVRRESIDSAVCAGEGMGDFFSDDVDEDDDVHDDNAEETSRAELTDDSFDGDEGDLLDDDDFDMEEFGCPTTCNDDGTLMTAKTTSTSSTLSTLKSFNSQKSQDE